MKAGPLPPEVSAMSNNPLKDTAGPIGIGPCPGHEPHRQLNTQKTEIRRHDSAFFAIGLPVQFVVRAMDLLYHLFSWGKLRAHQRMFPGA